MKTIWQMDSLDIKKIIADAFDILPDDVELRINNDENIFAERPEHRIEAVATKQED